MSLWSGVGDQLLSSCCCGHGWSAMVIMLLWTWLVVSYYHHVCHHVAVVTGWRSIASTSLFLGQGPFMR